MVFNRLLILQLFIFIHRKKPESIHFFKSKDEPLKKIKKTDFHNENRFLAKIYEK